MSYFTSKYGGSGSNFNDEDEAMFQQMNEGLPQSSTPSIAGKPEGMDLSSIGTAGAGGAAMGGPAGAGIAVGGQFLAQYLNHKAAQAQQKRQNAVNIEEDYTKNQTNNLSNLLAAYRGALR